MEIQEWLNDIDIPEQDKITLSNKGYDSPEKAFIGGASTIRMSGSDDHFIDRLVKLKTDKLSPEHQASLHKSINRIRGVPKDAEGYEVDTAILESPNFDKELMEGARQIFHKGKAAPALWKDVVGFWQNLMTQRAQVREQNSQKVSAALREELGDDANRVLGDPKDEESIGTIKRALMHYSKELGFDYQDEEGNPKSHLFNELDMDGTNGPLGDKPCLAKVFAHLFDEHLSTGATVLGGAPTGGGGGSYEAELAVTKEQFPESWESYVPKLKAKYGK